MLQTTEKKKLTICFKDIVPSWSWTCQSSTSCAMPHLNLASHRIVDILALQVMGYLQHYFLLVLWIGQLFKHVKQALFCWASFPVSDCVHVCLCNTCVCVYDVWYMCVHFCERVDTVRPLPACGKQRTLAGVSSCLPPCERQTFVTMQCRPDWPMSFRAFSCFSVTAPCCRSVRITDMCYCA